MSDSTLHVLVVDDYENQYIYIRDVLSAMNTTFHVDWASTFEAGKIGISSGIYDVCLVDYDLGDNNGIDLLRYAVENDYRTPLILLTGHGSHEVDLEAMRAGAADYLDKSNLRLATLERSIRYAVERARTMNALRESEARQRTLMETIAAGIYILQDQQIVYINPAFEQITGYTLSDLQASTPSDCLNPTMLPTLEALRIRQKEGNSAVGWRNEVHLMTKDKRIIWLDTTLSIIELDGEPAILGTVVDITDRKRAETIEHQQRTFAEALLDIATVLNQSLDFDDVLSRILESVERVVPHDTANIMLIDDNNIAYVVGSRGYDTPDTAEYIRTLTFYIPETPTLSTMLVTKSPLIVGDVLQDEMWLKAENDLNIRSYVGVPILISGQVIGYLNIDSHIPNFFNQFHADRLRIFAELAAIAIRNAQTFQQAQARAAEEERQRLARELHDAVSQTLFSASMIAETLPRLMERNPNEVVSGLRKLSQLTKGALAEMRTLLLELRPASFEQSNMLVLLEHLANAFTGRTQIPVELSGDADIALPLEVKVVFYRIAQEALNNVMKHARATQVWLQFHQLDNVTTLCIEDDGRGFNLGQVSGERMGLSIMQERAASINARLQVNSALDEGTEIILEWRS
ncbi:MAG: hypothetical protein CUN55_10985 [Phototrophicales bacterium]|nr:MAG: hypothetical protein CUN55_10985 [Phototrophicales bacterium]